jgi:hypothetical protein
MTPENAGQDLSVKDIIDAISHRRSDLVNAAQLAAGSSIAGVRASASELASALGGSAGESGFATVMAVTEFRSACTEAGWMT